VNDVDPTQSPRSTNALPVVREDASALRRRVLLEKLVDDRADLKRIAGSIRTIAHTVDTAQRTLALTRRSLRWLLLAGSAMTLGLWLSNARRTKSTLIAGLSMQLLYRALEPSAEKSSPQSPGRRRPQAVSARAGTA